MHIEDCAKNLLYTDNMNEIEEQLIQCPYCGENQTVLIDCSVSRQTYIEDCQVCCQPINFDISIKNGELYVEVKSDNE